MRLSIPSKTRIVSEIMRISFMAVFIVVIPGLAYRWLVYQVDLSMATLAMIVFILCLRLFVILIFPHETLAVETKREKVMAVYSEMFRTFILSPILVFFYVMRLRTPGSDLTTIMFEISFAWFVLNLFVIVLFVAVSYKAKSRSWYH